MEAKPVVAAGIGNPADAMAATYKAVTKKLDRDDTLTWHGITVYGTVDAGFGWQTHGAP